MEGALLYFCLLSYSSSIKLLTSTTYRFSLCHSQFNAATKHLLHFAHYRDVGKWNHLKRNATMVLLTKPRRSLTENHKKTFSTFAKQLFVALSPVPDMTNRQVTASWLEFKQCFQQNLGHTAPIKK